MNWPLTLALLFAFGLIIGNVLLLRLTIKPCEAAELSNSATHLQAITKKTTNQRMNTPE